jgi:hypothetical protein
VCVVPITYNSSTRSPFGPGLKGDITIQDARGSGKSTVIELDDELEPAGVVVSRQSGVVSGATLKSTLAFRHESEPSLSVEGSSDPRKCVSERRSTNLGRRRSRSGEQFNLDNLVQNTTEEGFLQYLLHHGIPAVASVILVLSYF